MHLDYWLFTKINIFAGHVPLFDFIFVNLANYGIIIYAAFFLYLWFQKSDRLTNRKLVIRSAIAALIALGLNQIIGLFYFRPRPFMSHHVNKLLPHANDSSFPSDHSALAGGLNFSLYGQKPFMASVMMKFTILMMIARVYVGVHYPTDVLGGLATGALGSIVAKLLWPYLDGLAEKLLWVYDKIIPVKAKGRA